MPFHFDLGSCISLMMSSVLSDSSTASIILMSPSLNFVPLVIRSLYFVSRSKAIVSLLLSPAYKRHNHWYSKLLSQWYKIPVAASYCVKLAYTSMMSGMLWNISSVCIFAKIIARYSCVLLQWQWRQTRLLRSTSTWIWSISLKPKVSCKYLAVGYDTAESRMIE